MLKIGCHLSNAGGYYKTGLEALRIGANTFQIFTRNPRGARAKAVEPADFEALRVLMLENNFAPIIAHAPYTMNPCSKDPHLRGLAAEMMADDLARMELLPGNYYNFHPGSHTGQGVEAAVEQIASMLNSVLKTGQKTVVLLETMSGKGSEVGGAFEHLRDIITRVERQELLGVCFDSCHLFDAGYNVRDDLDGVLAKFDRIVGLARLRAFHINDSLNPCGSRKDRHALIGEGQMGLEATARIINHPLLRNLPFILETPTDSDGHAEEIALLKSLYTE